MRSVGVTECRIEAPPTAEIRLRSRSARRYYSGVKSGLRYGSTDDYGYYAAENKVHIHDLHATILHLLGLNHERLTFRHAGRDFRLTDVEGNVVHNIFA